MGRDFDNNVAILRGIVSGIMHTDIREAELGKKTGADTFDPDPAVGLTFPDVWVTEGRRVTRAKNLKTSQRIARVPVMIGKNLITGETEVIGVHATKGTIFLGAAVAAVDTPEAVVGVGGAAGVNNEIGGLVRLARDDLLFVEATPFWYHAVDGTEAHWSGGQQLNLTSSVPGTANFHVLVRVALDTDSASPILVATSGTAVDDVNPLLPEDAADISLPIHYEPLATVLLRNGDTTLNDDQIWDERRFFLTRQRYSDTHPTTIATNDKYTIATKRGAVWFGPITVSGLLTIKGRLKIEL